jgi:CheY-like chemotaxis protein
MRYPTAQPQIQPRPRVVIAESDADTQALYCEALQSLAVDVVVAGDGRDALVQCLMQQPALVITDTRLPYVDGYALCELLRDDPMTRNVPIIIITAEVRPAELLALRRVGPRAVLAKPVTLDVLKTEVERVQDSGPEPPEPAEPASEPEVTPRTPYQASATRRFQRFETTTPAIVPPPLRCPSCDRLLEFRKSRIGGVTRSAAEQWDEFACPECHDRFEYRHRTRNLREIS